MMKRMEFYKLLVTGVIVSALSMACTDLTEELPDSLTELETEEQFVAALGEAYTILASGGPAAGWQENGGLWSLHEVSSDEAVVPQRGPDWFDGGIWLQTHRHTTNPEHGPTNNAWQFLFAGVNATSRLAGQFETLRDEGAIDPDLAEPFIAEMKVLRGFYYFWLLDTFGNVPIIDDFTTVEQNPPNNPDFQAGRTELFNFIESQVLDHIDLIADDPRAAYGRMHRDAAHFLLAKLYLNAEVYTGSPRWDDALFHLDTIIDSGNYELTGSFFSNFAVNNSNSPETIFAIPYDEVFLPGFNIHHMTLHYGHQFTFNFEEQPWNGYATLQEFYESFEEDDVRREGFITGPQFRSDGTPLLDPDISPNHHLNINPEIPRLEMTGGMAATSRERGARFNKFEYELGASSSLNNDFPVFRYADVLLMKAEVLWRTGQDGTMYFNMIRERAGVDRVVSLDGSLILAERGRELYTEMWRRQDLIRFDGVAGGATRFNDPWWEKNVSQAHRNVFPIPRDQIDANPNLNQNPGY